MKQGEVHEVTEYAIKFTPDQNIFKVPNKESISIRYAGNKQKKLAIPLNDYIQEHSFNRSMSYCNFRISKKENTFGHS